MVRVRLELAKLRSKQTRKRLSDQLSKYVARSMLGTSLKGKEL